MNDTLLSAKIRGCVGGGLKWNTYNWYDFDLFQSYNNNFHIFSPGFGHIISGSPRNFQQRTKTTTVGMADPLAWKHQFQLMKTYRHPIHGMYGIFTYIYIFFLKNGFRVSKYTIVPMAWALGWPVHFCCQKPTRIQLLLPWNGFRKHPQPQVAQCNECPKKQTLGDLWGLPWRCEISKFCGKSSRVFVWFADYKDHQLWEGIKNRSNLCLNLESKKMIK